MINKDDIERLKALRNTLGFALFNNPNSSFDNGDLAALDNILAHLDQPYQWGDDVEVQVMKHTEWVPGYKFIGLTTYDNNPRSRYIVEDQEIDSIEYVHDIRHPKQTVQVTLDKELVEDAKTIHADSPNWDFIPLLRDLCKAIAQEGEDNE